MPALVNLTYQGGNVTVLGSRQPLDCNDRRLNNP
jgi:hypothetical protein